MRLIQFLVFIRSPGAIEPFFWHIFIVFLREVPYFCPATVRLILFVSWWWLGSSEGRTIIRGESEGVVKVLTEFS